MILPLALILYALVTTAALAGMKSAPSPLSLHFIVSFFFYGCGAVAWITILRAFPLSKAFPVAASILIITTTLAGTLTLGEQVSSQAWFGIGLLLAGLMLVATAT
jgi:multidrug transporter EmrE-like cation transporter